ncbi:MAG: AAA domain-containing protein [Chitinivibrionales bacterium]|nr:AAA domain-containing protein [Chitinivibrionales bacterium]
MEWNIEQVGTLLEQIRQEVGKVIIGQKELVDACLVVIFSGQHALIEGVPGVAKTLLVRTLAHILGAEFNRIQFTPDLMPSDITGTNIFNLEQQKFNLVKGPVFCAFLLADEINRAPAKTQSALLQAMQEKMVTIDGVTYRLADNFTVFATQNPIEFEGTYPLPEAQKDRFMLKLHMDYPRQAEEHELAQSFLTRLTPEDRLNRGEVQSVLSRDAIKAVQKVLPSVTFREELVAYSLDIVRSTRNSESVLVGAGPRATQSLLLAARMYAVLEGRDFVTPDDIKIMSLPVLEHRLILRPEFEIEGLTVREATETIIEQIEVPR